MVQIYYVLESLVVRISLIAGGFLLYGLFLTVIFLAAERLKKIQATYWSTSYWVENDPHDPSRWRGQTAEVQRFLDSLQFPASTEATRNRLKGPRSPFLKPHNHWNTNWSDYKNN